MKDTSKWWGQVLFYPVKWGSQSTMAECAVFLLSPHRGEQNIAHGQYGNSGQASNYLSDQRNRVVCCTRSQTRQRIK